MIYILKSVTRIRIEVTIFLTEFQFTFIFGFNLLSTVREISIYRNSDFNLPKNFTPFNLHTNFNLPQLTFQFTKFQFTLISIYHIKISIHLTNLNLPDFNLPQLKFQFTLISIYRNSNFNLPYQDFNLPQLKI